MFEAARMTKGGVTHIKDLDLSVVKRESRLNTPKKEPGTCDITLIDLITGETKTIQKPVRKESLKFDFNSKDKFNTDQDSQVVAKECWDWVFNPLGFDFFVKNVKDRQIMIIQNREGFSYQQDDPEDDLISLDIIKTVLKQSTEMQGADPE